MELPKLKKAAMVNLIGKCNEMSITKEQAIEIAKKVLIDINFWSNNTANPSARLMEGNNLKYTLKTKSHWLVSFSYGEEDFGEDVAHVFIEVDAETGEVDKSISNRSGSIKIEYDEINDKYKRLK